MCVYLNQNRKFTTVQKENKTLLDNSQAPQNSTKKSILEEDGKSLCSSSTFQKIQNIQ